MHQEDYRHVETVVWAAFGYRSFCGRLNVSGLNDLSRLNVGDPAPWFRVNSSVRDDHAMDLSAGRHVLLTIQIPGRRAEARPIIRALADHLDIFDGPTRRWLIVTGDERDRPPGALPLRGTAVQAYYDTDGDVVSLYGLVGAAAPLISFVLTPRLQIAGIIDTPEPAQHAAQVMAALDAQLPLDQVGHAHGTAPVLIIPNVFEPALCQRLIEGYQQSGGQPSGFMREVGGRTVLRFDDGFKVRRDWMIDDQALHSQISGRFGRRVIPEIQRAYNFAVTHLERYLVACYDAEEGGHFAAHRDHTARGTMHRRFACSLNLNDDYNGGDLVFPEFGTQTFRPPPGGCAIFSSALLHQANKVTAGRRYAFLPFLHDDAAEEIRRANAHLIDDKPTG